MANTSPKKKSWISDEDYDFIFARVPRLCVDLVVKDRRGVILSRRDIEPAKHMWHIPGGRVRYGETITQAITRVAKAELGLRVVVKKQLGYMEGLKEHQGKRVVHSVSLVFLVSPREGSRLTGSWQAGKADFFRTVPPRTFKLHAEFLKKLKLL